MEYTPLDTEQLRASGPAACLPTQQTPATPVVTPLGISSRSPTGGRRGAGPGSCPRRLETEPH